MITEIFIDSKNGCDWYSGEYPTSNCGKGALKTIARALVKIERLRKTGARYPMTVWLMPGEYPIDSTITVPKECGNITFRPFGGEVSIIGAKKLENVAEDELYGVKCLSAKLPDGVIPEDLFVNDKRADITKYPESGTLSPIETGSKTGELYDGTDWMISDRDLTQFDGICDSTIVFRHFWIEERLKIESIDKATNKIVFTRATPFTAYTSNDDRHESTGRNGDDAQHDISDANSRMDYVIEGLPQLLKKPNQWVYKSDENKVYYIPESFDGENNLYVPTVTKIFDVYADYIHFENISFKYTSSHFESEMLTRSKTVDPNKKMANDVQALFSAEGVINFYGASNCSVNDCTIREYGLYGICIDNYCSDIDISKCRLENSGGGGIKVSQKPLKEDEGSAKNISVTDCLIKNIGLVHTSALGILMTYAQNCKICHNEICYTGYSGISVGWEWGYLKEKTQNILIEKNHIHHISQGQLSDLGGIYLLGVQPGTRVLGNLIHDVYDKTYGASGIYADEGASLITFENNICYNVSDNGFQLHFGYQNIVRNNIFESGRLGSLWDWMHDIEPGLILRRNIFIAKDNDFFFGGKNVDILSATMESDNNLFWSYGNTNPTVGRIFANEKKFDKWQDEFKKDQNGILADPLFNDYDNKDFGLKQNSPAYKLGISEIDMSDVGIRKQ